MLMVVKKFFKNGGEKKYMSAIRKVKDLSLNPEFVGYYDREEAIKWDMAAMKQTGIDEGKALGEEIGKALGEKIGINKAKIEMVENMLKDNAPLEIIAKYTDLKLKEIKKIQKELEN